MHNKKLRLLSIAVSMLLLLSAFSGVLSAAAYWVGQSVGIGTVTATSSRSLGSGLTYASTTIRDYSSNSQNVQTLTFNPSTSNYMPLVYSQYNGYGATTLSSAKDAENKGYDVKGGVNASFFSMMSACSNTYGGVTITDGKIAQGCNSNGGTWVMTFNSNGTSNLVYSRVIYTLTIGGTPLWGALDGINMCPNSASDTNNMIYYYDRSCGNNADVKTAGVEVVFNKVDQTELTVGGTLIGQVSEIRNISSGGAIGANQFVLFARNSSSYAATLRGLTVGSRVTIGVTESITDSKTVMENCNSAFPTYGYNIVRNGVNVTSSDGLGESFNKARAQRTGLGVKADGTIIVVAAQGRTSSYPGLTVYQLADLLISQGCVTGIDLDGGGSTAMCTENTSGTLAYTLSSSRRVANSLLVVSRPTIPAATRNSLSSKIQAAQNMLTAYNLSSTALIDSALAYGRSIYNSSKSMPGDYTKAIMRLDEAMKNTTIIGYKPGMYTVQTSSAMRASAASTGTWLAQVPAYTSLSITQSVGDWGYTKYGSVSGWVYLPGSVYIGSLVTSGTTINTPTERYSKQDFTASWNAVPGASGYTYAVVELNGEPQPGNSNEGANGRSLCYVTSSRNTSVTIPASSLTPGKYLKIAVGVEFPQGTVWTSKYVKSSELPFTDVATNSWYYNAVKHVYGKGYFSGTSGTTFAPENTMTRGMLAVVLYRMAGCPAVSGTLAFTDVPSTAYYYDGILWCNQNGIATGYNSTTYGPDDTITREQAAVFLYRLANVLGYDTTVSDVSAIQSFADADTVGSYAVTAMAWAVEHGIMNGNGGYLMPKNSATRAQVATLLCNFDNAFGR